MTVHALRSRRESRAPIVFSALDSSVAGDVEAAFARAGRMVLSNAKNFRMEDDVPLVIPEVNADHLALLDVQRAKRGWKGGIVTNANCASIMAVMALAPLHEAFGVTQAVRRPRCRPSPAPAIPACRRSTSSATSSRSSTDEEPKIETEIQKMLGHARRHAHRARADRDQRAREPRRRWRTATRSACRSTSSDASTPDAALEVLRAWRGDASGARPPELARARRSSSPTCPTVRSRAATWTPGAA